MRRTNLSPDESPALDVENECLWRGEERILLSPKAYLLLRYLADRPQQLLTRNQLLDAVWADADVGDAVLTVTVNQLRSALGDGKDDPRFIETVHRRGYRLREAIPRRVVVHDPTGMDGAGAAEDLPPSATRALSVSDPASFPLVGRQEALHALHASFQLARGAQRQLAFVTGETGIGKTLVVDEFVKSLSETGPDSQRPMASPSPACLVARGQCLETYGSGEAYLPVLDALRGLAEAVGREPFADLLRRIAPSWLAQLPSLCSAADRESLRRDADANTRTRMLRELAELIEVSSEIAPLILVFEDLHWSDPSTLACLSLLTQRRNPARLLLVATYRPFEAGDGEGSVKDLKQQLHARRQCVEIALPRLAAAEVGVYLETRLGSRFDDALTARLHASTEGNPLLLASCVDELVNLGSVPASAVGWALGVGLAPDDSGVPARIQLLVEHQLQRLGDERMAREVIEFGCVSGLEFGCEAVAACLTVAAAVVEDIGDKLSRRGLFLRPTGAESLPGGVVAARFTFTHALYRDALYRRIPAARRARAHHKLGLWIAAQGGRPGEVAYHLLAAGDRVAAVRFRLEAAEQANVVCAFDEAAAHFAAAQQLLAEQPATESTRVDILVRLGQAQQRGGAIARAQQTLIEAIDLARQFQLAPALAQATLLIGHGYQRLGRNDVPLQAWLDEALTLLADADPLLRARLLAHLQFVLCEVVGTDARRQHLGDEALAIARRSGDPDTLLWVLHYTRWSNHGPFDAQARLAGVAELAGLRGMVHGAEAGLTIEVLLVADLLELGDIAAAKAALGRLDAALQDAPIPWCVWFAERLRSMCALHVGDLDAAERALHEGWRVGQHMDNPNVLAVYVAQQVILAMLRGTPEIVEPIVRQAVAAAPQIVAWRCVLSYLCAELGSLDEAGQLFEEVMGNGLTDLPQDSVWLVALTFLSLSAARLGLSSAAPRILELLHPQAERCSGISAGLFSMGSVRRYLALLSQTGGTRKGTRRAMQEAVAANRQLGASPWLAQTLVEAAASASNPAERKQAMAYLDEADSIATRLGLRGLADRIAQLRSA